MKKSSHSQPQAAFCPHTSHHSEKSAPESGKLDNAIVTVKLKGYTAAKAKVMLSVEHVRDKGANNRAESLHQPTRERDRRRHRFKFPGEAQLFLSTFSVINNHFLTGRHLLKATQCLELMGRRYAEWRDVCGQNAA